MSLEDPIQTPWNRAKGKTRSQLQEERIAKMPGGEAQVNSGRFWRWKRDAKLHNFLIEARTTEKGSYSIKEEELLTMKKQAAATPPGLLPGMQIDFPRISIIAIELAAFQDLNMRLIELETLLEKLQK